MKDPQGRRALPLGTVIHNRYQITRVLGEGGFGITYLAVDARDGSVAAVKEYMPQEIALRSPDSPRVIPNPQYEELYIQLRDQFLEEAQIIYQYQGRSNIIEVRHRFYGNDTAYYVMEYLRGTDLSAYLAGNGGRISWEKLGPVVGRVVEALTQIHASGMIHCDISPDNIFLLEDGGAKLIDFGAAKSIYQGHASIILLKRHYAPPEQQMENGKIGPWTDIFALAVTIYRCVTGRLPEWDENGEPVQMPLEMGVRGVTPAWEMALKKAMSLEPGGRFRSAEEFWKALRGTEDGPVLWGLQGLWAGKVVPVQSELLVGTDESRCSLVYPRGTPGVSRLQFRIWPQNGGLMVMDMGSSFGTWINDQRLQPGFVYSVPPHSTLVFGGGQAFLAQTEDRAP